MEDSGYVKP